MGEQCETENIKMGGVKMAEFKKPKCPYCGTGHNNIRVDTHEQKLHCTCNYCHKSYTVIHGNGKCRTVKGQA